MTGRKHSRDGIVHRWVRSVAGSPARTSTKALMFYLVASDRVTDRGALTFHRESVATELGIHPQRITERIADAKLHRLLQHVGGGWEGRTAEYVLVIPTRAEGLA